jgi:uncharacterized membrane protein SpoIIM required for sporulation
MRQALIFLFEVVSEARNWILYVSFVFLVGIVCGVIISLVNPDLTRSFFSQYGEVAQKIVSESGLTTALLIFQRNATIVIVALILCLLGVVPTLVIFLNGMVFGMIFGFREIYENFSPLELAILILPHGLIELAAVFLGLGLATRTGVRWLFVGNKRKVFLKDVVVLAQASFFVVFLLLLSALVEAFLTPAISCFAFRICF